MLTDIGPKPSHQGGFDDQRLVDDETGAIGGEIVALDRVILRCIGSEAQRSAFSRLVGHAHSYCLGPSSANYSYTLWRSMTEFVSTLEFQTVANPAMLFSGRS